MTAPSVRRRHRHRSRGQALVLVALSGVAMIAIVGLALDGGYEAGNYRQTQNASDAGALAATRQIYKDYAAGSIPTCTSSTEATLQSLSNTEIGHNRASAGDSNGNNPLLCVYQKTLDLTEHAHSALATVSAGVNVGLASVTANVDVSEATSNGSSTAGSSGSGSASGQVDLASVNATVTTLGIPVSAQGNLLCLASSRTTPGSATESTCPVNSLSAVGTLLGALGSITGSAGIALSPESTNAYVGPSPTYEPDSVGSNSLATVATGILGTTVDASAANVASHIGVTQAVPAEADLNLASVSTGLLTLAVSMPLVTIHAQLDYTPSGLVSAPTPTCVPGSLTIGGTSFSFGSNCHIVGLPVSLLGVTLADFSSSIVTSGCPGTNCSESGCFLKLSVVGSVASVCVGEFDLSASGTQTTVPTFSGSSAPPSNSNSPGTPSSPYNGASPTVINGVQVQSHISTPVFFMGVFGWKTTTPTATTTAEILPVNDESNSSFNSAAYAVAENATAAVCNTSPCSGQLTVGNEYYIYGSHASPVTAFGSTWDGQVSASNGHAVGDMLSAVTGVGSGPATYVSGGDYYLLPVVDQTGTVQFYSVFQVVTGSSTLGTLVNNIPVEADPSSVFSPSAAAGAAAMTILITQ